MQDDDEAPWARSELLERQLASARRALTDVQGELLRTTRELETLREQGRTVVPAKPRGGAAIGLFAVGVAFGAIVSFVLQIFLLDPTKTTLGLAQSPTDGPSPMAPSGQLPGSPGPGGGPSPNVPGDMDLRGRVVSSTAPHVHAGTECRVSLVVGDLDGAQACQALITCGSSLLYGGERRGFFPCTYEGADRNGRARIRGEDRNVTSSDGDPGLELDTSAMRVRVWETSQGEPYDITIQLDR